ncbi:DNA-binding protein [Streptomyces tendae]|uniref:DNA-binding protein n=1 Tax=Streptomyces tendae TaxID=1932 RepID=UPI0038004650
MNSPSSNSDHHNPVPPTDLDQEYMTVQETAFTLRCSVSWLRRFLREHRELHSYSGRRIITNREDRAAIYEVRRAGDPRKGRPIPQQRGGRGNRASRPAGSR